MIEYRASNRPHSWYNERVKAGTAGGVGLVGWWCVVLVLVLV